MITKRTGYKFNFSGRSIKACGTFGKSNSPASHSGWDPNLPRGQSSLLNFDFIATEEQLSSIRNSLIKLMRIRQNEYQPTVIQQRPLFKRANRMNF